MKTFLTAFILVTSLSPLSEAKLYSFDNYPEIVQEAISRDIHKPNPNFITEVPVASGEVTPKFLSQLIFDKVSYSLQKKGELTKVRIEYKDAINSYNNAYRVTYLHMLGMRITHYSRSEQCSFNNFLKTKENKGLKERAELLKGNHFIWLNHSTSNLQSEKNIEKGLRLVSKYCQTSEKELTSFQKLKLKIGFLKYEDTLNIPEEVKSISLAELSMYDFFKVE